MAEVPAGVFCLLPAGRSCSATALSSPNVDGIAIRQDWSALEPTEGNFDFSYLDSEVARAAAAGKKVLLRVLTQANKPAWVTAAVTAAGGQFFTFEKDGVNSSIPVFWDPTFIAKKKAMIARARCALYRQPGDPRGGGQFRQRQQRRLERAAYTTRHRPVESARIHLAEVARCRQDVDRCRDGFVPEPDGHSRRLRQRVA